MFKNQHIYVVCIHILDFIYTNKYYSIFILQLECMLVLKKSRNAVQVIEALIVLDLTENFSLRTPTIYHMTYKVNIYLTVSADPLSPPTVENLTATGVCFPMLENISALQYFVISCVTSK